MSVESLLQQIDQEYQGLDYEALLNKADEWLRSGRLNTGYSAEAVRARALLTLNKAIALQPEEAKAYAMKGVMIYEDFIESHYYNYKAYCYTPRDVNKESYMTAYESIYKAWTLQPNKKKHIRNMSFLFNPHFDYYCPGMTSVKQHLTDDQINLLSKFIMDIYTKTELKNAKLSYTQELYKLVSKILLIYKNKDLLNLKIKLTKLLITYDTQNNPGDYEVDQAASFLDLGEDEKGKLVYQNLLARDPKFPFNANRSILSEPIEGNLHRNMVFLTAFIKVDPNYPYSYYTIGRIIEVHFPNETAKAFEYYSQAESLMKDGNFAWKSDCLYRMARLLSIDGKFQQALIAINKAQAIESSSPKIGLEKGRILKSCGQVTLAFFELERAQKLGGAVGAGDEKAKEEVTKVNDAILKEKEELLRYFGSKIMQDQVDKVKETLDYDSVAQMKKDIAKIQTNQALKDYYDQFVFAFSSLYGTSQVVISGQLSLDTSNTWLDLGAHALSLLPFYGDTIEAIFSTIKGQFIGADMKGKAQLFCLLAVNQTQLDSIVSYITRKIVLNPVKTRRIVKLSSSKQEKETVSEFWEKINKFYTKFKSATGFKDYNLRSNTPAAKLALKDTATLISRIIKNETLLKKSSEERSDEIVELFFCMEEEALEKAAETKANVNNIIPVKAASGGFLGCFGRSSKTK